MAAPTERERRLVAGTAVALALGFVAATYVMRFHGSDPYGPDPSTTRAGDFTQFGGGARVLRDGQGAKLYDAETFQAAMRELFPPRTLGYEAVYPPPVYQALQPFIGAPWGLVTRVHGLLEALLFALAAIALVRTTRAFEQSEAIAATFLAASPVFIVTQDAGQISGVWFAIVAGAIAAWTQGRPVLAGVLLGLLCAKPTLALLAVGAIVLARGGRVLAGFTLGGAVLLTVSGLLAPEAWNAWFQTLAKAGGTFEMMFLRPPRHANFRALLGWAGLPTLWAIATGAALGLAAALVTAWRARRLPSPQAFAIVLSAASLGIPHLFDYELWLHAPSMLLGAAWVADGSARRPRLGVVLGSLGWWFPMMYYRLSVPFPASSLLMFAWVAWLVGEAGGRTGEEVAPAPA